MKQRRIGLTGGIASGKSTVGQLLAVHFGLPVLDADRFAREALAPGTAASAAVLARYGEAVRAAGNDPKGKDRVGHQPDGQKPAPREVANKDQPHRPSLEEAHGEVACPSQKTLRLRASPAQSDVASPSRSHSPSAGLGEPAAPVIDRAALGRIVFADPAERHWLEQLIHPEVRRRFALELERLDMAPVVVLMIPLLFETGLQNLCSEAWLVDCDPEQQLQRLMVRNSLSEVEARARIAAQWPLERKRAMADRLIDNRGAAEALMTQVAQQLRDCGRPGSGVGC
jgi:dephospho-CoA kinase